MTLAKDTVLQRVSELNIEIRSNDDVSLVFKGSSFHGNLLTLAVLDAFSSPRTFEEGVELLRTRVKGTQSWIEITAHVAYLHRIGVLQDPAKKTFRLRSHSGRFDGAPVHIRMLNDRRRTASYQQAIREAVTSSDTVVDIGTGTGVLAATAAMAGARHVYAVESTGMATLAKEVFAANGLSSRITVIEGRSTQIELPKRAALMVSEMIGNDPLSEGVLQTTEDAVKRLLKPDARLIPASLRIFGLPVTVPDKKLKETLFTPEAVDRWRTWYGIDFSPLAEASRNQGHTRIGNTYRTRDWLSLCEPILLKEVDLRSQGDFTIRATHRLRARHSGVLSGILIYFELALWDNVDLSIHPRKATPENSWASKLWIPGVSVTLESGEEFEVIYTYAQYSGSGFQVRKGA